MNKIRPPIHLNSKAPKDSLNELNKLTYLMLRRYLTKEPNTYPRFLYKYLSSEMPEEYLRCLLIDSDFYLNSCKNFNDPFDTTANVIRTGSISKLRKRFSEIANNNLPNANKLSKEVAISKMMATYSGDYDVYKNILNLNTQQAGLFSLTENSKNILMWSHYANQHKGIVLQFELAKNIETFLYAMQMHYSKDYPSIDITVSPDLQFDKIMMRKSKDWEYEKEWRILKIAGANTYQPFKPEALTGLIFGCKSEEKFINYVQDILLERESIGNPSINVFKAKMHTSQYSLKYFKLI